MGDKKLVYAEMILLLVAFFWGINPPIMKVGLAYLPPLPYNALRMLIAMAVAWVALVWSKSYRPFGRADFRQVFLLSLFGFFVFQLCFTLGVERTTAGNASLLLGLLPVSVAIINKVCKIEEITLPVTLGILLSLGGVVLIVVGSGKELSLASAHVTGALFLLGAQTGYGYYTVFSRGLLTRYSTYQITAYIITITTVLFLLVSLPAMAAVDWRAVPAAGYCSAIYSGVFALTVGNFLWIWGVGKLGSPKAALYNNLSPVFAITTGYLFLHEAFGWLQFAGAVAITAGLYITRTKGAFLRRSMRRGREKETINR